MSEDINIPYENSEPPTKKLKGDELKFDQINDDASQRRSKLACIRCRKRKTKCSGESPCRSCIQAGYECSYTKKPKKVYLLDTEIEAYKQRIRILTEEVNHLKSIQDKNNLKPTIQSQSSLSNDKINLSIWLGSPSCELICWNLNHISRTNCKSISSIEDILISPDFDSLIEENAYDYIVKDILRVGGGNYETLRDFCSKITLDLVEGMFDNLVFFINAGYLIINPNEFRFRAKSYFQPNGQFDINKIQEPLYDYFLFNILMVITLGKVYSREYSIGKYVDTKPIKSPPGLEYFSIVVKYLPSPFQLISLTKSMRQNIEVIELLSLISFYLRMLDKKSASLIFTLNALQLCISLNFHKSSKFQTNRENDTESNRVWWATYCLNRFFSARVGQQLLLNPREITAKYPSSTFYDSMSPNLSKYDFGNANFMVFYINLAKISDRISRELYCIKTPFDNRDYLNVILKILEALIDWVQTIPEHLRLNVSNEYNSESDRLIYSLHLNYLHHIYLTCVPILLNLTKMKISTHKKNATKKTEPTRIDTLPRNITYVTTTSLNACRLTINIFMTVYKVGYLSSFGFTDLDYLFSSSLVFIMGIILQIKIPNEMEHYTFTDYLNVAMSLMLEMNFKGNLVARGKLIQITNLLYSLSLIFTDLGFYEVYQKYEFLSKEFQNKNQNIMSGSNFNKTSIDNLLNDVENSFSNNHISKLTQEQSNTSSYGKFHNSEITLNTLMEFNLDKDTNFISNVDDVHNLGPEDQPLKVRYDDFTVTDEDILFFDQIMEDFSTTQT